MLKSKKENKISPKGKQEDKEISGQEGRKGNKKTDKLAHLTSSQDIFLCLHLCLPSCWSVRLSFWWDDGIAISPADLVTIRTATLFLKEKDIGTFGPKKEDEDDEDEEDDEDDEDVWICSAQL